MTSRSEIAKEIATRRARIALIAEEIADRQAVVQRLMVERSVIEGEIRGLEGALRRARLGLPTDD